MSSDITQSSRSYLYINLTFAAILAGIFVYAALYDPDRGNHPLPSAYQLITGEETISTGLSRSFSAMVRFRFDEAGEFNAYGPGIFLFFAVQLMLRLVLLVLMLRGLLYSGRWLILGDATQCLVLFVICFRPFLVYWTEMLWVG